MDGILHNISKITFILMYKPNKVHSSKVKKKVKK